MALRTSLRMPPWTRPCVRHLSTTRRNDSSGVLDLLRTSTTADTQRQPAKQPGFISRMADQVMPSAQQLDESAERAAYQKQMYRKWHAGDVYAPHDLSGAEQYKWKTGRKTPQSDAFETLGINPVNEYKNFTMLSEYMTEMGRIKHSKDTGLRPKNQRKIAKAIRRAVGLGLMPSVHRHPLVLKKTSPGRFM